MFRYIIILSITVIISCGKKGDLYLASPDKTTSQEESNGSF